MIKDLLIISSLLLIVGCNEDKPYIEEGDKSISSKIEVSCPEPSNNRIVLMTFGQSNSANTGQTLNIAQEGVFNFFNSNCYKATDPLLGPTGFSGSVWSRLGDMLVTDNKQVVISAFGVSGSSINSWIPGGGNDTLLNNAINDLKSYGMLPTKILWHQGETDVVLNMSTNDYYNKFLMIRKSIRDKGISAPIYIARATLCNNNLVDAAHIKIRKAQDLLIKDFDDIKAGPDTDTIGLEFRYDNCHFNKNGLQLHAKAWYEAIRNN